MKVIVLKVDRKTGYDSQFNYCYEEIMPVSPLNKDHIVNIDGKDHAGFQFQDEVDFTEWLSGETAIFDGEFAGTINKSEIIVADTLVFEAVIW